MFSSTLALAAEVKAGAVRSKLRVIVLDSGLSKPPETIAAPITLLPSTPKLAKFSALNCPLRPLADKVIWVADKSLLVKVFCANTRLLLP